MQDRKSVWAFLDISDPLVAWEVYRGIIIAPDCYLIEEYPGISFWQVNLFKKINSVMSINEIKLECIRQKYYPNAISRFRGLYCFESEYVASETAKFWGNRNHFSSFCLSELSIPNGSPSSKLDSNWISFYLGKESTSQNWMHSYWSGEVCPLAESPRWELLVVARADVLNKELRKQAYENLKKKNKLSVLPLMELSRIAAYIGFDLGHCCPYVFELSNNRFKIADIFDRRDANNPLFLEALSKYFDDPKNKPFINWNDYNKLKFSDTICVPDTTERNFEFELSSNYIKEHYFDFSKLVHIQ